MAEQKYISHIRLGDGNSYEIRDAELRTDVADLEKEVTEEKSGVTMKIWEAND